MRRREFVAGLAGAAAWPLAASAQQGTTTIPVVGFVRSTAADFAHLVIAFRKGLNEAGFIEGQNVVIEYRYANNEPNRLPSLVDDLIRRQVAVIIGNSIAALAAKAATAAIPIVFATGGDPVRDGLVASLSRPEGNVTGVNFISGLLGAKRLDLLHQLVPKVTIVAMLVNPNSAETEAERRDVQEAAQVIGQKLLLLEVTSERELETAFLTAVQREAGALLVGTGAFLNSQRERIVALAARHAIASIYSQGEAVLAGGLISYGASIPDAYRQVGIYAGRILRGEKPADLPVIQSTKHELAINSKTAKALGLTLPSSLLTSADEVIE
jgi:putative ABC transport system substrate-binding protein